MLTVYGLKNCDTCRKARKWLSEKNIEHSFVDLREQPVTRNEIERWAQQTGFDALLNKRGTTWRGLSDSQKALTEHDDLIDLIHEYPALIKRPVFVTKDDCFVSFSAESQGRLTGLA